MESGVIIKKVHLRSSRPLFTNSFRDHLELSAANGSSECVLLREQLAVQHSFRVPEVAQKNLLEVHTFDFACVDGSSSPRGSQTVRCALESKRTQFSSPRTKLLRKCFTRPGVKERLAAGYAGEPHAIAQACGSTGSTLFGIQAWKD